jgi:hypothetical protein
MGIEPTRAVLPEPENNRFGAMANPKCDQRVSFRGMWGKVRLCRGTSKCEIPGSSLLVVDRRSAKRADRLSEMPAQKRPLP